jgi:cyclohexanone monooxygenase
MPTERPSQTQSVPNNAGYDVVVVGAGFAGLYALHKLRTNGHSVRVFEAGDGVGGVWYWNRYPGARVDIEGQEYSYSFSEELEMEWRWAERYPSQSELLRYLNHVADRFDLRRDIQLETRVVSAIFDESSDHWTVATDCGTAVTARFCVMATGCLSAPKWVDIPGIETFEGKVYHTARWPREEVDFTGQRVAVVGTGSSGIQIIPQIARQASELTVFQRTPSFSLPAHNRAADAAVMEAWRSDRAANRQRQRETFFGCLLVGATDRRAFDVSEKARRETYEACWQTGGFAFFGAFADIVTSKEANDTAAEFVRNKIRGIINEPKLADILVPTGYPFLTKRPCVDIEYFETYNRDNVKLVDVKATPILSFTPTGVLVGDTDHAVEAIVLATGFDAMTGALNNIDIRGRGGQSLKVKWENGPQTYLGLMAAGFPNFFMVTGPGSPSVLTNMIVSIEQHIEWIAGCVGYLADRRILTIEATKEAEDEWVAHVSWVADQTLYPLANSWYLGANVPGKSRVFLAYVGGHAAYRVKCDEVASKGYEGFKLGETH